jgi:glycosyltransferase involved in cell wall biosynthesis
VSIITPTFNHARFIGACIDSVLAQGWASWEQIIIDDGSTDGTPDVVARYDDPRIRYVRQKHRGLERLAETYNDALAMCRAPLIAILEGDDYWPADKLAILAPTFADPDIVLAYGLTVVVGDGRREFSVCIPPPDFERRFPPGTLTNTPVGSAAVAMLNYRGLTFTYPCSVLVRREALERIGGFQSRPGLLITDHPTFLLLALEGRFHYEKRTMGYWRARRDGATFQYMDRILHVLHQEVVRMRGELGERLGLSVAFWREIESEWQDAEGWMSLRTARRLLVSRRWRDARPHLRRAAARGRWRTRATALLGLAASHMHVSVESLYRARGRPWFQRDAGAELEIAVDRPAR